MDEGHQLGVALGLQDLEGVLQVSQELVRLLIGQVPLVDVVQGHLGGQELYVVVYYKVLLGHLLVHIVLYLGLDVLNPLVEYIGLSLLMDELEECHRLEEGALDVDLLQLGLVLQDHIQVLQGKLGDGVDEVYSGVVAHLNLDLLGDPLRLRLSLQNIEILIIKREPKSERNGTLYVTAENNPKAYFLEIS